MGRADLLAVARGERPADLVLRDARLIHIFSGEVERTDLAIAGGRVVGWGTSYRGHAEEGLDGRYLAPGLIDAHVHIESSLTPPSGFARAVVPRGVTTVVTDPHEIANVRGLDGIRYMLRDAAETPLEVFVNAPSCVPASPLATSGASLAAADLATLRDEPRLLGLAELMSFPAVVSGEEGVLAKLAAFAGRPVDGHCPGLAGRALDGYAGAGISSDHESTTAAEARQKLRRGMAVFLREASGARNLRDLLPLLDRWSERSLCLVTDDRQPIDLLREGSIDHLVRLAIAAGVEPLAALRLATLNPAAHYRLEDRGALVPGRRADLVVFPDLAAPAAEAVYVAGRRVAEHGRPLFPRRAADAGAVRDTVHLDAAAIDFGLRATGATVRTIVVVPDQLWTDAATAPARLAEGWAVADPGRDLLKLVVVERHRGSGNVGRGFVRGFGLARGALAGTVAHDHHNLIAVGADDRSLATAARAVVEAGGGLAAAAGEHLLALLPLPLGGLMSDRPIEEVADRLETLMTAARELGSSLRDPFATLSFLGLEVIPRLKLTDRGLVDVDRAVLVPVFV